MRKWLAIASVFLNMVCIAQDPILIVGRNTGQKTLADGNTIRTFGFASEIGQNPPVPGPVIEVNEGDSVVIDFWNISQGAPHTIHLHGLDVNQQNDGVPHLSFEVHHMEHGFYRFRAPHAGTYLYHCHVVSSIHVQAGMYGLLIVKPPDGSDYTWDNGYEIHSEARLFMSEIDTMWHHDSVLLHDYDTSMMHHMVPIPVYAPQHFLINGRSEQQLISNVEITGQANSNVYVRLANIGFMGNRVIFPSALNARIVDSDGRPLPSEEVTDTVVLYPGERYGVLCNPGEEFHDFVYIQYLDMNTGIMEDEQEIAVDISGYIAVEKVEANSLKIFPNPASDEITLISHDGAIQPGAQIWIMSASGTVIKLPLPDTTIDTRFSVADLPPGIYLLKVSTPSASHLHRFVKI